MPNRKSSVTKNRSSKTKTLSDCCTCKDLAVEVERLKQEIDSLKSKVTKNISCQINVETNSQGSQTSSESLVSAQLPVETIGRESQTDTDILVPRFQLPVVNTSQPIQIVNGLPFKEFDISELCKEIHFDEKIGQREVKYYGEKLYRYGRTTHSANPLPSTGYLSLILQKTREFFPNLSFNSVLVTKYNNGQCCIPMHSDNEREIASHSEIVTISLGATRDIRLEAIHGDFKATYSIPHGSVYSMSAESQRHYRHGVPRDNKCTKPRVSITLRKLQQPDTDKTPHSGTQPIVSDTFPTLFGSLIAEGANSVPLETVVTHDTANSVANPDNKPVKSVDSLYISSSMFRNLKAYKLSTDKCSAGVHFYPGATAAKILQELKSDEIFKSYNPSNIKQIYILCGSNDVDNILHVPKHLRSSALHPDSPLDYDQLQLTKSKLYELLTFLRDYFSSASVNVINILPRCSSVRNFVINDLNEYLFSLCSSDQHLNLVGTEKDRYLFTDGKGYRKNHLFHVAGADNIHLSNEGLIKLAKLLKYLSHRTSD